MIADTRTIVGRWAINAAGQPACRAVDRMISPLTASQIARMTPNPKMGTPCQTIGMRRSSEHILKSFRSTPHKGEGAGGVSYPMRALSINRVRPTRAAMATVVGPSIVAVDSTVPSRTKAM